MAYPVDTRRTISATGGTSLIVELPPHQADDLILVVVAISTATSLVESSSSLTLLLDGTVGATTKYVGYMLATSDSMQAPSFTSGANTNWVASTVVIRDANIQNPIDVTGYSFSSQNPLSGPAITTTEANCLVFDMAIDTLTRSRFPLDKFWLCSIHSGSSRAITTGYKVAKTAGSVAATSGGWGYNPTHVEWISIAIRNKVGGTMPPEVGVAPFELAEYMKSATSIAIEDVKTITTSIAGIGVNTSNVTMQRSVLNMAGAHSYGLQVTHTSFSAGYPEQWLGAFHAIPSSDFASNIFTLLIFHQYSSAISFKKRGLFLADANNNWIVYKLPDTYSIPDSRPQIFAAKVSRLVEIDKSTSPVDLSAVTKMGYCYLRNPTAITSAVVLGFGFPLIWDGVSVIGGGVKSPASLYAFARMLANLGAVPSSTQGFKQVLFYPSIRLGDDSATSYVIEETGASIEIAAPSDIFSVVASDISYEIAANSDGIVSFKGVSFGSGKEQVFRISQGSSPSASFDFRGATFYGISTEWNQHVPCVEAIFVDCYSIQTNGAVFSKCSFSSFKSPSGVFTSNPGSINNCSFMQGTAGGHAIEITQPGTFAFVGNTFTGYGLDGTTDAAIYNNSGGHVTLNVSGGGDTPTVRNGAGATTDVVSGAQITVVGLAAGSQVKVTKVSNGDVLFNAAETGGQISFSTTYIGAIRIDARKASASPFYKPWFSQTNTVSGQTVEITALQELDE